MMRSFQVEASPARAGVAQRALRVIGIVLLTIWGLWWTGSVFIGRLIDGNKTWIDSYWHLGVDLQHSYAASRHWLSGGDPYMQPFGDELDRRYNFPPVTLPLFAWSRWIDYDTAVALWTVALTAMVAAAAHVASRARRYLGLSVLPGVLVIALSLWSTPVIFAIERGTSDAFVLVLLVVSAWSGRDASWGGDIAAGASLGLAAGIKVYPAFTACAAFVTLRRWRSLGAFAATVLGIVLVDPELAGHAWWRLRNYIDFAPVRIFDSFVMGQHSLTAAWERMTEGSPFGLIPALPLCGLLLVGLALWVGRAIRPVASRWEVVYVYFLLLTAAATFLPSATNDYNLIFLPVGILAVWDLHDPWPIQLLMALFLPFWQPVRFLMTGELMMLFKMAGLAGLAYALVYHAGDARSRSHSSVSLKCAAASS